MAGECQGGGCKFEGKTPHQPLLLESCGLALEQRLILPILTKSGQLERLVITVKTGGKNYLQIGHSFISIGSGCRGGVNIHQRNADINIIVIVKRANQSRQRTRMNSGGRANTKSRLVALLPLTTIWLGYGLEIRS